MVLFGIDFEGKAKRALSYIALNDGMNNIL
jgi:hypothetical protein